MGGLFTKKEKPKSRITEHDKAVLQLKQQRDRLKQYQKRLMSNLEKDRELAKKCLQMGRKDRAKSLLRKKKYQETLLANTDNQLENLEKLAADIEFAQIETQVVEGLKQGNSALKSLHQLLDINEIEKIMDETREGVEKQHEIDAMLSDVLTAQDEEDVLAELDALATDEEVVNLPEVPNADLPVESNAEAVEAVQKAKTVNEKSKKVLVEA